MSARHRVTILAAGLFAFANFGFTSAAEPICANTGDNLLCVYTDTAINGVVGVVLKDANGVATTGATVFRYCSQFSGTQWVHVGAQAETIGTSVPVDTGLAC